MADNTTREDIEESIFQQRLEEIKLLPPGQAKQDAIKALTQDYEGQKELIAEELAVADEFANMTDTSGSQAGGIYVAANPWSHAVDAVGKTYGAYKRGEAMDKMDALSSDKESGLAAFYNNLSGSGQDSADIDSMQGEVPMVAPAAPAPAVSTDSAPSGQSALASSLRKVPEMEMQASHPVPEQPQPPMMPSHPVPLKPQPEMQPSHVSPEYPQPAMQSSHEKEQPALLQKLKEDEEKKRLSAMLGRMWGSGV